MSLVNQGVEGVAKGIDDRLGSSNFIKRSLNKVFPDHWSFMLGEIALYSFIILLLTGTYLTLFFDASMEEVLYEGSYVPLKGIKMSEAYASTLDISFDVRGGLLMRQIHHWAALLFMAAIVVHLMRVFFTGAFRKPRELNWVIGTLLLILGIVEGFAGYSLPDDLLSGTGLRITYGIMQSIPVLGTWAAFLLFGGEFPGTVIIGRMYALHILLIPGIILGLITFHLMMIWYQKHTQFPGPGRTEHNVVGSRLFPVYAAKAGGFFFLVFAVLALLGGVAQINPIWLYGPYDPTAVTAGSQPDWYMFFLDGTVRLMPNWEIRAFDYTLSLNLLLPAQVLPGLIFTLMLAYPWLERWITKDKAVHNLLDRPRDKPVRTGIGAASIAFYILLMIAGANDIIASIFEISIQTITYTLRVGVFIVPPIVYVITKRICLGLQRNDQELLHHGIETGTIRRLPSGEFVEETVALPAVYQVTITGGEHEEGGHAIEAGAARGAEVAVPHGRHAADEPSKPRGFFRDKNAPRKEPIRPEAVMPPLEKSGRPQRPK